MTIIENLMDGARSQIRDFPVFFQTSAGRVDANTRTYQLPHKNVSPSGLAAWATDGTTQVDGALDSAADPTTFGFALDERNGLLRITRQPSPAFTANMGVNVEGYYFEWVSHRDMLFHTTNTIAEHAYGRDEFSVETVSDVEADIISLGAAVDALSALLVEYARDIDINTPEAISLPLSIRFRQTYQLLHGPDGILGRYKEKSHMLNVGLDRITMVKMRRVSRMTNRLVPLYTDREYDDLALPERQFPPVGRQAPTTPPPGFVPARRVQAGQFYEYPASPAID